mmetsp:Transcript_10050/g.22021  ORF Transcript_10050/g.22021 Transcript_10050/m.22021 type:complete len:208 (-) Transcript_10050:163-786(-)
MSTSLAKALTTPRTIARALDWQKVSGALLSIHFGPTSIDLAVTSHPSASSRPIKTLPSIPLEQESQRNQRVLKSSVLDSLSRIVEDSELNVCGFLVSWPVQNEGWCGAPCGKVLHSLDQIVQRTNLISGKRPVVLWDGHHFYHHEDEWGRTPIYSETSDRSVHIASRDQYKDEGMVAADIAADYLKRCFPDFSFKVEEEETYKFQDE